MSSSNAATQIEDSVDLAPAGRSLWTDAFHRLKRDRIAVVCFAVVLLYGIVAIAAALGLIASPWDTQVGAAYAPPSFEKISLWFGTDIFGRSVLYKTIHGTRIAMSVGLVTSMMAIPVGVVLGAIAGYFGGWVDSFVVWLYTVLDSVPSLMLLLAIAYALDRGIMAVYISLSVTSWVGLCRVIRGEFIKHKNREYVVAATSMGASHFSRIFRHVLPNVSHFVIIFLSMQFMSAIKAEVILSFLGVGVQGQPSWGIMIDDSKLELARGVWWQLAAASMGMFFVVLALNIFGDALRDALDPKIK